jgi:hypothetical protein
MSNIIDLSVFKGARSPTSSERGEQIESSAWGRRYRRSGRNMHNLVFRSYSLIVEAPEADLVRDVRINTDKAKVKLRKIREQIVIDRDKAAARVEMMSKAEAKLSAAIVAAQSHTPEPRLDQPRRSKLPRERPAGTAAAAEAAANVTQLPRRAAPSMLEKEFAEKIAMLDESGRQYITGYIQPLFDQKGKQ